MAVEGQRAIESTEGRRGDRGPYREQDAIEGPRANLFIAIIASRLSRLSLKFTFSRKNDYRDNHIIFSRKTIIVWSLFFAKNEAK